jgi:transcriptional regulator with XRE-family HTH domain
VARTKREKQAIGARIKVLRANSGMRQATIAKSVGISIRQFQNWQAGAHVPDEKHLEDLAKLFGVTANYILTGEFLAVDGLNGDDLPDDARLQLARIERRLNDLYALVEDALTENLRAAVREAELQAGQPDQRERRRRARDQRAP